MNSYPSLRNAQEEADIAIIGGGITGALIAYALIKAGYSCILIDKGDIAQGSTSATTAMIQYEIDVPLIELKKLIGEEQAVFCYRESVAAIEKLCRLIEEEEIACDYEAKQSLYIAHDEKSAEWLQRECQARAEAGIRAKWLQKEEIQETYSLDSYGGILSEDAASLDAYCFAHKLLHKTVARGLKIFDQTKIDSYKFGENDVTLHLADNATIKAGRVVFCNGFEAVGMIKAETAKLHTTYACISEQHLPFNPSLKDVLVWDTANPYFYMRATGDGRLLLGGEDTDYHKEADYKQKDTKSKKLMQRLKELSPSVDYVEDFTWAGTFGTTKDGLPYIGAVKEYPNCFFVLGFGGNGITFSVQGQELILDLLQNSKNPLLDLYRFYR